MVISSLRRIVSNAVSMLASEVVSRAATFVLYALVARYLGASEFGRLSLALALCYTFQVLAVAGLKTLVTRAIAQDRTKTDQYLVNGSVVVAASSLLSIATLLLFVRLMGYPAATASIVLLLSLGLLPYSLSAICEAVFQAWERMQYIAYANVTVSIVKVSLAFLLLARGDGLYHLGILLLASSIAIVGIEWWLILRHITTPRLTIAPSFSLAMTRAASTFLGIDGIIAISGSLHFVLLSKLASETEVGLYSAANQVMVPVTLICHNIVFSVFPMMCRRFDPSFQSLRRITEQLIALLLAIALPIAIGLFFLADSLLVLLYGHQDFLLASGALRIMVWNLILIPPITVLGQVLVASQREKVTLRIIAIDALVGLVFGLIFIGRFGLLGAAMAAVLTKAVDFLQHYVPVSRLFSATALGRLTWNSVVAGGCMAAYLVAVRSWGIPLAIVSAGAVYVGVLLALATRSVGGLHQLKARYVRARFE